MIATIAALLLVPAFADAVPPIEADASSHRTEGATIRLVAEPPDASGRLRAAIVFELEPGWKTYWKEPGGVGLAPEFELVGARASTPPEFRFPLPTHLLEGEAPFNGYERSVAVAFETIAPADGRLEIAVRAGICRDICVPVSAQLQRDVTKLPAMADMTALERAFLSLPGGGEHRNKGQLEGDTLVVTRSADDPTGELFVAGPDGWSLGVARIEGAGWHVPVLRRPETVDTSTTFEAILDDGATGRRVSIEIE